MKWDPSVRTRHLIISILLALLVASTCVCFMLAHQVKLHLAAKRKAIETLSEQLIQLAQTAVLQNPQSNPQHSIGEDQPITTLVKATVGERKEFAYCAIISADGTVLAQADPAKLRQQAERLVPFEELDNQLWLGQLRDLWRSDKVFQINTSVNFSNRPFFTIIAGVTAPKLRQELSANFKTILIFGLVIAGLGLLGAAISAGFVLRPLRDIVTSIELLEAETNAPATQSAPARPQTTAPLAVNPAAAGTDMQNLALRLRELGKRFAGSRSEIETIRDQLQQVVGNLTERVLLLDRDQRVLMASPEAEKLLANPRNAALPLPGLRLGEVLPRIHPVLALIDRAFQTRQSLQETLFLPNPQATPSGTQPKQQTVLASIQLFQERGQPAGALLTLRDFETIQRLETELDFASKVAALNRITAGVAHEVKNPLHSMVLHLELLTAKLDAEQDPKPHLDILTSEVNRLKRVVQTFLDFTRPVEVKLNSADANTLVREVVVLATDARAQGIDFIEQYAASPLPIKADADLLKQALLNIIINGCQAMTESGKAGGKLTLTTRRWQQQQEDLVLIAISDIGPGIPPEAQDKIFNLYFTTKPAGSGIGLAQAFRAVQLHNGRIELETELGKGTTFKILLPHSAVPPLAH